MYSKGKNKGTIRFTLSPSYEAGNVAVAGDFNGWKLLAMKKGKDGIFAVTAPISQETFEYKFIVDDQWIMDPDHSTWAANCYGTFNSVGRCRAETAPSQNHPRN